MSAVGAAALGLYAATQQLNVAASNLANSQDTGALAANVPTTGAATAASPAPASPQITPAAAPYRAYQPLQLVQFSNGDAAGGGVSASVQPASPAAYAAYAPSSTYADANGQVAPDIDLPSQIASQASALIQFQANLKVIETSDQMQKSLLDQSV